MGAIQRPRQVGANIYDTYSRVENDRDKWEQYNDEMDIYKKWLKKTKTIHAIQTITDEEIEEFATAGFLDMEGNIIEGIAKPRWKYDTIRKPQSLLVLDEARDPESPLCPPERRRRW